MSDGLLTRALRWAQNRTETHNPAINRARNQRVRGNPSSRQEAYANQSLLSGRGTPMEGFAAREAERRAQREAQNNSQNGATPQERDPALDEVVTRWQPVGERTARPETERVQQQLLELGFDLGKEGADGYHGDNTRDVIKRFQGQQGHEQTGDMTAAQAQELDQIISQMNSRGGLLND